MRGSSRSQPAHGASRVEQVTSRPGLSCHVLTLLAGPDEHPGPGEESHEFRDRQLPGEDRRVGVGGDLSAQLAFVLRSDENRREPATRGCLDDPAEALGNPAFRRPERTRRDDEQAWIAAESVSSEHALDALCRPGIGGQARPRVGLGRPSAQRHGQVQVAPGGVAVRAPDHPSVVRPGAGGAGEPDPDGRAGQPHEEPGT